MRLKNKIVIVLLLFCTAVTLMFGYFSFITSKTQIINKVSASNLSVVNVIDNNLTGMQKNISDWVTVFTLSSTIQNRLQNQPASTDKLETELYSGPMASIMDQMLATGNLDYLALYGTKSEPLYQIATDGSYGSGSLNEIWHTDIYKQTMALGGASYWFPLDDEDDPFIVNNQKDKIGMTRIIRSVYTGKQIGFAFVGVNKETIRKQYLKNLYDQERGIVILDSLGNTIVEAGKAFYSISDPNFSIYRGKTNIKQGSQIVYSSQDDMLVSYSEMDNGWRILYAIPLKSLIKELNAIKLFVLLIIGLAFVVSIPLMSALSWTITAPVGNLLKSMKRFQNGCFHERVEVKYNDEIGQLSRGYNEMVGNIKSLVDDAYILKLKEQEAELKALQSQINPHFLYNMLDTIYWEAAYAGQDRISEMVVNLSRLFRLSLNQGKSFTSMAKEKELITLYLTLQQMRFKDRLRYSIDIPDELEHFVLLKLSLQPFIENALIHGIERKREGGQISIRGELDGGYLKIIIEDNGVGMDAETVKQITEVTTDNDISLSDDTSGYGIQNVIQRLRYYYKENYRLKYTSEPGTGTQVELTIPVGKSV
ncbi:sensor histidine kinase [Paenibacillus sp. JNUCC31]|uniref:sensor histidine kinase n=1 Tax=Paenibacillus sp. JNUCC-31 TaxID=2777983 RepID=UPI001E4DDBF9|nr:sensor histidine kinase [Paenibacillus sp. JNUCC-31]